MYRPHLLFLLGSCLATTGCATLSSPVNDIFAISGGSVVDEPKNPELTGATDGRSFVVEMRGTNNESKKIQRPLTDEATYIQGVLVQSNALKYFGRVKIELWRPVGEEGGYHKLDIPFDRKSRSVPPAYDYAIHEGDRLVFMKDESNIFDDMLESIGGF